MAFTDNLIKLLPTVGDMGFPNRDGRFDARENYIVVASITTISNGHAGAWYFTVTNDVLDGYFDWIGQKRLSAEEYCSDYFTLIQPEISGEKSGSITSEELLFFDPRMFPFSKSADANVGLTECDKHFLDKRAALHTTYEIDGDLKFISGHYLADDRNKASVVITFCAGNVSKLRSQHHYYTMTLAHMRRALAMPFNDEVSNILREERTPRLPYMKLIESVPG